MRPPRFVRDYPITTSGAIILIGFVASAMAVALFDWHSRIDALATPQPPPPPEPAELPWEEFPHPTGGKLLRTPTPHGWLVYYGGSWVHVPDDRHEWLKKTPESGQPR